MYSSTVSLLFSALSVSSAVALPEATAVARALRGLGQHDGLSREEVRCSVDSQDLYDRNPALKQILLSLQDNIEVEVNQATNTLDLSFKQEYVTNLEAACRDATGVYIYLNETDFVCSYMGQVMDVDVDNFVQCLAETTECQSLDQVTFLEEIWDSMDLECRLKGEPASPQTPKPYYSSSSGSTSSSSNSVGNSKAYNAGVLAGQLSFLALCVGAVVYFIRHSEGQRGSSYQVYEMSTQEERILT
jgi:hypothetical protein